MNNLLLKQRWDEIADTPLEADPALVPSRAARIADARAEPKLPTVAILLCTYYGQQYLSEQLDSFAAQSHKAWTVHASDDGSEDGTCEILEKYREEWHANRLVMHRGPSQGFVANFLSLACNTSIQADFYAFADQDDIWEKDKVACAVHWLETVPADVPALYCSRTCLVDSNGQIIGYSPLFKRSPSFANALVQNIAGGNTMIFNDAARQLLCRAGQAVDVVAHDWWMYMVLIGCGGRVCYDPNPSTRYRQHGKNLIGSNADWVAKLQRLNLLWQGRFRHWSEQNIAALQKIRPLLTPENQRILDEFSSARHKPLLARLIGMRKSGIWRQTRAGNLGLLAAIVFKKI